MSIPAWNQNNKFKLMMPCTTYGLRANQHKFTHYTSPGEAKHIAHTMRRTTNASIDTDPICKYNQTSKRDTETLRSKCIRRLGLFSVSRTCLCGMTWQCNRHSLRDTEHSAAPSPLCTQRQPARRPTHPWCTWQQCANPQTGEQHNLNQRTWSPIIEQMHKRALAPRASSTGCMNCGGKLSSGSFSTLIRLSISTSRPKALRFGHLACRSGPCLFRNHYCPSPV
jgi:hypothetical protein